MKKERKKSIWTEDLPPSPIKKTYKSFQSSKTEKIKLKIYS